MLKNILKSAKIRENHFHEENQYLNLIDDIIKDEENTMKLLRDVQDLIKKEIPK